MREDIRTWFFDCDGVLLDSNAAKTDAFGAVAEPYGEEAAEALVRHHVANGGISRWAKFQFLFDSILKRRPRPGELDGLVERFGVYSKRALGAAREDPAVVPLLSLLKARGDKSFVVSGGHQDEVRAELTRRGFTELLDGVFGSPRDKRDIVEGLLSDGSASQPAAFVGDGVRDWQTARELGLQFAFVRHWSEWQDWRTVADESWVVVEDLGELLEAIPNPASATARPADA